MDVFETYEKYQESLDEMFDDSLIITYNCGYDKPQFKIVYDSDDVNINDLKRAIPAEWMTLEKEGKITISLEEFSTESEEYKRSVYITDVILKDKKDNLIALLKALNAESDDEVA